MKPAFVARLTALIAVAGIAFACTDRSEILSPVQKQAPKPGNAVSDIVLACSANIKARTVSCGNAGSSTNGIRSDLIVGGQHQYVLLESSNIQILSDTIAFDVDMRNLIEQTMGTTDSLETPDPSGIKIFFTSGPTSGEGGSIVVANADGVGTFTAPNQPFFAYHNVLEQFDFSDTKTWKLQFSPEVQTFSFLLYVSAPVRYPTGYVDSLARVVTLNPTETFALPATVKNALGNVDPHAVVVFNSSTPAVATVLGSNVTGVTNGFSVVTASSGTRPGTHDIYADVCPSTTVSNGTSLATSISNTDCFAALSPDDGYLPSTTHYGDLYRVSLTAGQTVDITVDTGNILDSRLVVADRLGLVVAENDDDPSGTLGVGSAVSFTATDAGTYIIQVTTFNAGDTGNYTLGISVH